MTTHRGAQTAWRVPFVRPDLPAYDTIEPVFRQIHASGILT